MNKQALDENQPRSQVLSQYCRDLSAHVRDLAIYNHTLCLRLEKLRNDNERISQACRRALARGEGLVKTSNQ